jgi:hypothetical protein
VEVRDVELGKARFSRAAGVLLIGLVLAGCNDGVEILRDPDVRFAKGMTWAWRPMAPALTARRDEDTRPVLSRDVITQPSPTQHLESNRDWNTEANRKQLQEAIERSLKSKGLTQVKDPETADFLVDYHLAVKTQRATVPNVYPGFACGPYGCWSGWGWGPPEFQSVSYHVGTFVLDIALQNPRKLAYRAISHKELSKQAISPYQAEEAVNHLLKGLKVQ